MHSCFLGPTLFPKQEEHDNRNMSHSVIISIGLGYCIQRLYILIGASIPIIGEVKFH